MHLPIFEYTLRASSNPKNPLSLTCQIQQVPLTRTCCQISNGVPEIDSGKVTTIAKHIGLTKVVAKRRRGMGFYVSLRPTWEPSFRVRLAPPFP